MNYKYLILIACSIGIYFGYYLLYPISIDDSIERASDELSYYCTDQSLDCTKFIKVQRIRNTNGLWIHEWQQVDDRSLVLQIRVPEQRIGDLTFGLIGSDVTLGTVQLRK